MEESRTNMIMSEIASVYGKTLKSFVCIVSPILPLELISLVGFSKEKAPEYVAGAKIVAGERLGLRSCNRKSAMASLGLLKQTLLHVGLDMVTCGV